MIDPPNGMSLKSGKQHYNAYSNLVVQQNLQVQGNQFQNLCIGLSFHLLMNIPINAKLQANASREPRSRADTAGAVAAAREHGVDTSR